MSLRKREKIQKVSRLALSASAIGFFKEIEAIVDSRFCVNRGANYFLKRFSKAERASRGLEVEVSRSTVVRTA